MRLSVIIPAFNEAERIGTTLESVHAYLSKQDYDYEVIVITDGSQDNTVEVVQAVIRRLLKNIRLIINTTNRGKGAVVKQGMIVAHGDWRLFMDADNATTIDQIEGFWPQIDTCEVLVGSRRVTGANIAVHQPWWKEKLGQLANLWIQLWVAWGIKDTQAGFKMLSAQAAQKIFTHMSIDRFGFDYELIMLARHYGYRVKELPITWQDDNRTHVKLSDYITMFFEPPKLRCKLWFGKYT